MKFINITPLFSLLFLLNIQIIYCGWLDRKAEGWFWYEDRLKKSDEIKEESPPPPQAFVPPQPSLTASEQMASIRKDLEESLNQAILDPSDRNVVAYMQMQQHWINQSSQFSQAWLKNLLNHPRLDSRITEGAPITHYGVQVQKQILREAREDRIHSLVKSYGLFFFYEGKNKVSQAFSIVVEEFSRKYGWQVIGISCDGVFLSNFDNNHIDQGITKRLGIDVFPSLFLVEPKQQQSLPIAFGLSSVDQIEENIDIQINKSSRSPQ